MAVLAHSPIIKSLKIELHNGESFEANAFAVKHLEVTQKMPPLSHNDISEVSDDGLLITFKEPIRPKIEVVITLEGDVITWTFSTDNTEYMVNGLLGGDFQQLPEGEHVDD